MTVGRAIDAVAPALDGIVWLIRAKAIGEFGIDVSRPHWEMTSISLVGDYDVLEDGCAEPSCGHPKIAGSTSSRSRPGSR
jgi:hypothetical protein